jgi:hypothetical protein
MDEQGGISMRTSIVTGLLLAGLLAGCGGARAPEPKGSPAAPPAATQPAAPAPETAAPPTATQPTTAPPATTAPPTSGQAGIPVTVIDPATAPADVQAAAGALASSPVVYPIAKPGVTYLVIATGSDARKVKVDRAEGDASMLTLHLKEDPAGRRLLIATVPMTGLTHVEVAVDGEYARIPALSNKHNLPLVPLPGGVFVLVSPKADQVITGDVLHVSGYGRPFEATFGLSVENAAGEKIGSLAPVMAGSGPNWGSFVADVPFDRARAGETGFLVLTHGGKPTIDRIPIRFVRPPQMG